MSPSIVFKDGKPIIGLGSPGGTVIIGAVYQVITNILDWNLDPLSAVLEPRAFANNTNSWRLEPPLFNKYGQNFTQLGITTQNSTALGVVAIIMKQENEKYLAAHDPRRDNGLALVE